MNSMKRTIQMKEVERIDARGELGYILGHGVHVQHIGEFTHMNGTRESGRRSA